MGVSAGSKRKALKLINQVLVINLNGYSELTKLEILIGLANEKAHKPNFGEKMLGLKHDKLVADLTGYLMQVKPSPDQSPKADFTPLRTPRKLYKLTLSNTNPHGPGNRAETVQE
ncbi:TPA: hypothetical protein HA243_03815 [Candidatus Micrarchaeota archaeon]|nr:hypothetical protein [Candidatus Micrarchaeota archaeon]